MFILLKMVLIGIDPYPFETTWLIEDNQVSGLSVHDADGVFVATSGRSRWLVLVDRKPSWEDGDLTKKHVGKPWENHRKTIGKPWENHRKMVV